VVDDHRLRNDDMFTAEIHHFLEGEFFCVVNAQVARCTACCSNVLFQEFDRSFRSSCDTRVSGPVLCTFIDYQKTIPVSEKVDIQDYRRLPNPVGDQCLAVNK